MTFPQSVGMLPYISQHNRQQAMQLDKLLSDATGCDPSTSKRFRQLKLTEQLNEKYPEHPITEKGVEKWFERGSIPSDWLVRIIHLPAKSLDLRRYA